MTTSALVHREWDDVVGYVLITAADLRPHHDEAVVHEVGVTYPMEILMPSLGYDRWATEPERPAKDSSANIRWGGASTYMQECLQNGDVRWQRSPNAVEFGNRKEFCYKSKDKYGNQLFRFFRPDGSNITIRIARCTYIDFSITDAEGLLCGYDRYTIEAYDNPRGSKRGKRLWKREVDEYHDLGYDASYNGYGERLVTRLILLYGARVLLAARSSQSATTQAADDRKVLLAAFKSATVHLKDKRTDPNRRCCNSQH